MPNAGVPAADGRRQVLQLILVVLLQVVLGAALLGGFLVLSGRLRLLKTDVILYLPAFF